MAYQQINLGTPNNNDGDSLYAGGFKINANFLELYTALGTGSAIRINLGTPVTSTVLGWSTAQQKYVPVSSDAIRTLGSVGRSTFFITNAAGVAGGADADISSVANIAVLQLEGRSMFSLRVRNNTSVGTTRGSFEINLGNSNVTSLSVYTTGVAIRGVNGLELFRASSEDTASYTRLLDSTSTATGVTLYQTPVLDFATMSAGVRQGTDSSNSIAHTGFVRLLLGQYALSSTAVRGVRGVVGSNTSNNLSSTTEFNVDGVYHPKHCEGLIYNYNISSNVVTLVTGAAAHWAYSTSGVPILSPITSIAIVASYTPILRTFTTGWTPDYDAAGSTPAVIDSTLAPNRWYYLYYLGCLQQYTTPAGRTFYPGSSNVVISSNRDIESVDAQLRAAGFGPAGPNGYWQVVRRLGPVRTNADATPKLLPFNVKRIDHGAFEYYWGLQSGAFSAVDAGDSSWTTTLTPSQIYLSSQTLTASPVGNFTSALLTQIPPIPGVTAFLTVRHRPSAAIPYIYMYGEAWTVNSSIATLNPPFEVFRSTTSGVTNTHNIQLPMSPDGCYIPDGTFNGAGILSVMGNTGQTIRYAMVAGETSTGVFTSAAQLPINGSSLSLRVTVTGFRYAR